MAGSSPSTPGLLVTRSPSSSGHHNKERAGSPTCPRFPSDDRLRSPQTPVVSCRLAVTPTGLLPSTRARVSAFSPASTGIILWTTTLLISELHDAAYCLATPGSVQPLAKLHAGSLLSGWLNRTTEDSYTSSQAVSVISPALKHRATPQRPINGAEAGFIRRCYVARPFMAGNCECTNVAWIDLGFAQVGLESSDSHPLGNTDLFPEVPSIP